jgi:hypothetical protein
MTPKERIVEFADNLRDDISESEVLEKLDLYLRISSSLAAADQEGTDHDAFFDEMETMCREEVLSFDKVERLRKSFCDCPPSAVEQVRLLLGMTEDLADFDCIVREIEILKRSSDPPRKTRRQLALDLGIDIEDIDDHLPGNDEEAPNTVAGTSQGRSSRDRPVHRNRGKGAKSGPKAHKPAPNVGRKPSAVSRKRNDD